MYQAPGMRERFALSSFLNKPRPQQLLPLLPSVSAFLTLLVDFCIFIVFFWRGETDTFVLYHIYTGTGPLRGAGSAAAAAAAYLLRFPTYYVVVVM